MAKEQDCAVVLISHVNKKARGENANNAALVREETDAQEWKNRLCDAVKALAQEAETLPVRVSYAEVVERFGEDVFGGKQPKRALECVRGELEERGVRIDVGVSMKRGNRSVRGVTIFGHISDRE